MNHTLCFRTLLSALLLCAISGASGGARGAPPPPSLFLTFVEEKDWTIHLEVELRPENVLYAPDLTGINAPYTTPSYAFRSADVVFPLIESTASSITLLDNFNFKTQLLWESVDSSPPPVLIDAPPAIGRFGHWRLEPLPDNRAYAGHRMRLVLDIPVLCRETRLNERAAAAVRWPALPWPPDIQSALEPQRYVESDDPAIDLLLSELLPNQPPRSLPPLRTAKTILARVIERFQPTTMGYDFGSTGLVRGFDIKGARAVAAAFSEGETKVSPFDLPCIYVALCRAAGLPARLVIGFDPVASDKQQYPIFHAWAEVYLYDENAQPLNAADPPGRGEWIPVDPIKQREFASRAPPINTPWLFLGTHEHLKDIIPLAHTFHPPTSVLQAPMFAHGSPALWGWRPEPSLPLLDQQLRAFAGRSAHRAR